MSGGTYRVRLFQLAGKFRPEMVGVFQIIFNGFQIDLDLLDFNRIPVCLRIAQGFFMGGLFELPMLQFFLPPAASSFFKAFLIFASRLRSSASMPFLVFCC